MMLNYWRMSPKNWVVRKWDKTMKHVIQLSGVSYIVGMKYRYMMSDTICYSDRSIYQDQRFLPLIRRIGHSLLALHLVQNQSSSIGLLWISLYWLAVNVTTFDVEPVLTRVAADCSVILSYSSAASATWEPDRSRIAFTIPDKMMSRSTTELLFFLLVLPLPVLFS